MSSSSLKLGLCRAARIAARQRRSLPSKHTFKAQRLYSTDEGREDAVREPEHAEPSKAGPSSLKSDEPLFKTPGSPWDLVFQGIDDMAPPIASSSAGLAFPRKRQEAVQDSYLNAKAPLRLARRQAMTASEINAFDDMFNLIFQAVNESRTKKDQSPYLGSGIGARQTDGSEMASTGERDALGALYGSFKRRAGRTVKEDEELLDRKREQIEMCATDHELLEWAMNNVFDESVKYEQAAREAVADSSNSNGSNNKDGSTSSSLPALQPPCYAALLALLMRTFREKYRDPHTALSLFAHAQRLSVASYVFGCTTPAYNELLQTRWSCFRDLRGVADALTEMRVNGVQPDARTRALAEEVRREVGARNLWQEESGLGVGANESVFELLRKIEELSFRTKAPTPHVRDKDVSQGGRRSRHGAKRWTTASESWKNDASSNGETDEYKFGDWDFETQKRTNPWHRRF